jgi:hypothetical protein
VFDAWLTSPGHRDNMRGSAFTDIGIGFVPGTSGNTYDTYWTMVLAAGDSETGEPIVVLPPLSDLPGPNSPSVQDPVIQVSEVPLPPAFWLFAAALATGLLALRRQAPAA